MSYVGNVPTTAAFPFDQFSGNGVTTAFTLSYAPAGSTSIIKSLRFGIFTVSLTSENFGKAISASKWDFFIFVHCLFYYLC